MRSVAPSAYLMLKPVVCSSRSQLCSFASSLWKDKEVNTKSTATPASPFRGLRGRLLPFLMQPHLRPQTKEPHAKATAMRRMLSLPGPSEQPALISELKAEALRVRPRADSLRPP